jgi:ribosome biogenesis GTP-binding protein YsxC/EngB
MKEPLRQTKFLIAETDPMRVYPAQAEVALVGRSNVGKSSTLCALCDNKTLARVSKMPGRTRGINVFEAVKGRWIVDLPGYGFAMGPQKEREYWPKMIGNYLSGRKSMALVLVLVDGELGIGTKNKQPYCRYESGSGGSITTIGVSQTDGRFFGPFASRNSLGQRQKRLWDKGPPR